MSLIIPLEVRNVNLPACLLAGLLSCLVASMPALLASTVFRPPEQPQHARIQPQAGPRGTHIDDQTDNGIHDIIDRAHA